jgi:carbonic anhydrase
VAMQEIVDGIKKFKAEIYPRKRELFSRLASGQSPSALVISCADSRVDMQLVTQSEPGQLFVFRNAGNIVPPYGAALGAVSATIEYAMVALDVPHIIVSGHSDCGAMKGVLRPEALKTMPTVSQWLSYVEGARQVTEATGGDPASPEYLRRLTHENIVFQLDHLRTHPSVAVRIARGTVDLHGWYYDIESGEVTEYDPRTGEFVPLLRSAIPEPLKRPVTTPCKL